MFAEGAGDVEAIPVLVRRLFKDHNLWGNVNLDPAVFRIGAVEGFSGRHAKRWLDKLSAARLRPNTEAILVVLDGDCENWENQRFCARDVACTLAHRAKEIGAGNVFSLGVVFACLEYESWFLAGLESLAGKKLADGRLGVRADAGGFAGNPESAPRGAKGELSRRMASGYKPTTDQALLTKLLDLDLLRKKNLKSFARLERAVVQLAAACQTGRHIATPPSR